MNLIFASGMKHLDDLLEKEIFNLRTESELHKKVRVNVDQGQREYYLKEQLKVIQDELGYEEDDEIAEYIAKINDLIEDEKQREKLLKEANKLAKIPFGASEGTVIHNYLDTVLEFPWKQATKDEIDLKKARKILDADHEGIEKVKNRVLEYLAVKSSTAAKFTDFMPGGGAGVGKPQLPARWQKRWGANSCASPSAASETRLKSEGTEKPISALCRGGLSRR